RPTATPPLPPSPTRRSSDLARRVRWKALLSRHGGKINAQLAKQFEADHYDSYLEKENAGGRSLCGHFELDAQFWGVWPGAPFYPDRKSTRLNSSHGSISYAV